VYRTPAVPNFYWLFPLLAIWVFFTYHAKDRWTRWLITGMAMVVASALIQAIGFNNHLQYASATDKNITITVEIHSYFKKNLHGVSGNAMVVATDGHPLPKWQQFTVELHAEHNLYEVGEVWTITGLFKPIVGVLNSHGFDRERQAFQKQLVAIFVVDSHAPMYLLKWGGYRATLHSTYKTISDEHSQQGLLQALAFGTRYTIAHEQWLVIVHHGLSHLFAISGLHIGLAFLVGWGVAWLWVPILRLPTWLPVFMGVGAAVYLGFVSGFSLPTQRAVVALIAVATLSVFRVKPPWQRSLEAVMLIVLFLQPSAVLSASFWLSFSAVFIMLSTRQIWLLPSFFMSLVRLQCCFALGLLPLSLWFFGGASISGLLTNLLAVPLVSMVVMPLIVLALVSLTAAHYLDLKDYLDLVTLTTATAETFLSLSHAFLAGLFSVIEVFPTIWWSPNRPTVFIYLFVFFVGWLLLWAVESDKFSRMPITLLSNKKALQICLVVWSASNLSGSTSILPSLRMTTFDVGHGLAMAVDTPDVLLVYDTGNAWQSSSYAQAVIEPFVREARNQKPFWLVVSHDDADHSAGAQFLVQHLDPYAVLSPSRRNGTTLCLKGMDRWIGNTHIEVLWPPREVERAYNPHSCVIKVTYQGARVLLTGDIDKRAEYSMLSQWDAQRFKSNIMSVPHHGSESSSSTKLIDWVSPRWAIAGTDYMGRWSLPKASVIKQYAEREAVWFDTGQCGAITISGYQTPNQWLWVSRSLRENQSWYRRLIRRQSTESVAACYRQLSQ
jgi:competence protein ComEC